MLTKVSVTRVKNTFHICPVTRSWFWLLIRIRCFIVLVKGYSAICSAVTEFVLKLAGTRKNGTSERLLRDLRSLDLLILDEWGYVPVDKDGSQLLSVLVRTH